MLTRAPLVAAVLLALAGCKEAAERAGQAEAAARSGGVGASGGPRQGPLAGPDRARVKSDLVKLRAAILRHQRLNEGANPGGLSDLEEIDGLFYLDEYEYDPSNGTVKSRAYPEL